MINKIIHFSDLHLRLFKEHDRYRKVLTEAMNEWKVESPDRVVFTGDLVHSKNQMTPELLEIVSWTLTECAKICKTIVLIGNHDFLENNLDRMDVISPIVNNLNNDNIVYYKDRGTYEDDNVLWCIYSLMDGNVPPDIPDGGDKVKIGLFHGPIEGSTTDTGFRFESGYSLDKFKGLDVVLCGDIHKRQTYDIKGGKKAYMVGSFLQQNFGENVRNHGYGIYDIKKDKYIFKDVDGPEPYLTFKITDIEDIENGTEQLTNF
tara:strand:+ start:977 stop:1759 length:783 start_codon:yes stop_codon:yes gene_type:complete